MYHLCPFISLCLAYGGIVASNQEGGENVALNKPVWVNGARGHQLTDGNFRTTVSSNVDIFPMLVVDLLDVYRLDSIHVHEGTLGNSALNITFAVYAWTEFTAVCDLSVKYPWTLVQSKVKFTKKGEEIVLRGPIEAQYVIILPERDSEFTKVKGVVIGELRAFGKQIRRGYRPETFDNDPEFIDEHKKWRRELLTGQTNLWVEQSYGEYKLSSTYQDVALAWYQNRINTMAVERGKARVIVMSGTGGMKHLVDNTDYERLSNNFRKWLSPGTSATKFVNVTGQPRVRDILLITRNDQFSVDDVYQKLYTGVNSAIIGYTGSLQEKSDDATRLMEKLKINYLRHDGKYSGRNVPLTSLIESEQFIPLDYRLGLGHKTWKYLSTIDFVKDFSETEVRSSQVQRVVGRVVSRYLKLFTYYSVCDLHPYKKSSQMDTALVNYNRVLLLQRGNEIQTAPGFARAPGRVHPSANPTSYRVTFNVDIAGSHFPMGGYAKPGQAFRYKVLKVSAADLKGFRIRINPQTDFVGHVDGMRRWPTLTAVWDMNMEDQLVSPFGGPIVVQIPNNSSVTIQFENVYRYPWFDNRNPDSVKNWEAERMKYKETPYLMIMGDNMISMLETPTIVQMTGDQVKWSTTYFDNMVKMIHNYRGTSHEKSRIEVFVTDDQISAGYGHSGYPWMGYRGWVNSFSNIDLIKRGENIGYPHEVGHNLQVGGMTFIGGGEVTNNMYISIVHKYLLGLASFEKGARPGYRDADVKQLIENWKNDTYIGVKESYYTYFGRYFSPALVGNTIHLVMDSKEPLKTEEKKVNFWISNMCNESGYDLVPFHRLWHFPINHITVEACGKFPCWFPDDEITQQVPDLVNKIKVESRTQCSSARPKEVVYKFDLMYGINKVKKQSIFLQT